MKQPAANSLSKKVGSWTTRLRTLGSIHSPETLVLQRAGLAAYGSISRTNILTAGLVVLFFAARLWSLFDYSLWGGEIFFIHGVRQDWPGMIAYIVDDIVHPPFFYFLLILWIQIGGDSMPWLKLLPALFSFLSLVPFLLLCRELRLKASEYNLALYFLAVNGFLIHYSQEIRNYILLMFFSLVSYWLFVRYLKVGGRLNLIALFVTNLFLVYSHYYGWLVVGVEILCLFIWERRKLAAFVYSTAALGLLYLPWIYLVLFSVLEKRGLAQNLDWITRPGWSRVSKFILSLNGRLEFLSPVNILLGLALFILPVAAWWVSLHFKKPADDGYSKRVFWWLVLFTVVPPALIFVFSYIYPQAMWIDRYFIFVAVPYLLLVSIAALRIRPHWARNILVASLVLWSTLAGLSDMITNRVAWESPQLGSRLDWENLAVQLSRAEQSVDETVKLYSVPVRSDGMLTGFWAVNEGLSFYLDEIGEERFSIEYAQNLQVLMANAQEEHFWVALFDLGQFYNRSPEMIFTDQNYRIGEVIEVKNNDKRFVLIQLWSK